MIRGFRHKGLRRFFETGSKLGVQAQHVDRLRLVLARLNAATAPRDMDLPGLNLHPLKGERKGTWSVSVSGNWRARFDLSARKPMQWTMRITTSEVV